MTKEEILEKYNDPFVDCIYGYMYGQPYINVVSAGKTEKRPDEIIRIEKSALKLSKNNDCFIYVWGWPGPDYNTYWFSDYGKTWAFSEEEIEFL